MAGVTASQLLGRVLRGLGVDGVYGQPFGALGVTDVPDTVSEVFARAHLRIHGARAAVHAGSGVFRLPGPGVGPWQVMEVASLEDLAGAAAAVVEDGDVEIRTTFDPDEPVAATFTVPAPARDGWEEPEPGAADALRAAGRITVLAGPGVVRAAAVPGLHDLAAVAGLGVLNTWGAKGIFHWKSQHHLATIGLQADDFVLGGLRECDLIIGTGLDPDESPARRWQLAPCIDVAPATLAALAERVPRRHTTPEMPPLRAALADVTQRGWRVDHGPLPPSRVTMHYAECVAAGALVAADAGVAGYWVARTLGTTRLGSVVVPSRRIDGFAAACVAVARLRRPDQLALAVIDRDGEAQTQAVLGAARRLGVHVPVELWEDDGERLDAAAHRSRLRALVGGDDSTWSGFHTLATDQRQLGEMVDAAGPVVVWT